jgi:hypothetical protein
MRKPLHLAWAFFKMILPLYMNVLQISLRDMNALYVRAEDPRIKKFRKWFEEGPDSIFEILLIPVPEVYPVRRGPNQNEFDFCVTPNEKPMLFFDPAGLCRWDFFVQNSELRVQ